MTRRSALGSSVSRCHTLSGGFPALRVSASTTSCSRFEPGKTMTAACIGAGLARGRRDEKGDTPPSAGDQASPALRLFRAAFAAARALRGAGACGFPGTALAPLLARLSRLGHGDRDRLLAALHLAPRAALERAVLVLVHHLLDLALLLSRGHQDPPLQWLLIWERSHLSRVPRGSLDRFGKYG